MQKYFVHPNAINPPLIVIDEEDAHHMVNVMRFRPGAEVLCSDGKGQQFRCVIDEINGSKSVTLRIIESLNDDRETGVELWLAQALPKQDKMEWILQKGTEVGISRFIPFVTKRTIVQLDDKKEAKRLERWRKIIKESAEQAHRGVLPELDSVHSWKTLNALKEQADFAFLAWEGEANRLIGNVWQQKLAEWGMGKEGQMSELPSTPPLPTTPSAGVGVPHPSRKPIVLIAIGPEGGFDAAEVEEAERFGWETVALGRRILRTETAGIVAATVIQTLQGEMGG